MKRLILLLSIFALWLNTPARAQQSLGIAAVVNDEIISAFDLESRLNMVLYSSSRNPTPQEKERLIPQILRTLIDDKLKLQEAKKRNIKVSQSQINKAIAKIEKSNRLAKGTLLDVLKKNGIARSAFIEQIKAEIAWNKLANRVLGTRIRVSEEEINDRLAEFQKNKDKPEHRVSEIFLPVDSLEQEKKVLTLANRLHQQLQKGVSFNSLARSFSRGTTANTGGKLGWIRQGVLGNKLQQALDTMSPGRFSKPIRADNGFYFLFLHERRLPSDKKRDVADAGTRVTLQQLFFPLSEKATLVERSSQLNLAKTMASTVASCSDMDKAGKELGSQMSGKLGTMTMPKLPRHIRDAISNLPVNKASKPIKSTGGILVLMVCHRDKAKTKAAPQPKIDDRIRVKRILLNERLYAAARRFLRDLRRSAFIDIRL